MSTRRAVAADRRDDYDRLWGRARDAAGDAGIHAWRFRAVGRSDTFMEFLEAADAASLEHDALTAALRDLDSRIGGGSTDHWEAT